MGLSTTATNLERTRTCEATSYGSGVSASRTVRLELHDTDRLEIGPEPEPQQFEKRFVALPKGYALGMHMGGAQRPIDVQSVTFGFEEYASLGRSTFRLYVNGPVNEPGFEGRTGYWAGFTLNGFASDQLPPQRPLADGLQLTSKDGATLSYDAGKLTLRREQTTYEMRFPLPSKEFREVEQLEIEVSPDLSQVGAGRFTATRSRKRLFGRGFTEPETVSDVTFGKAVDARDPAALAEAVTEAMANGDQQVERLLRAAFA